MGRLGIDRNDNFYFLSFSAFPNLFWLEEKPLWCFVLFWIFLLFFEFSIMGRVGIGRYDNFYFLHFSAFSNTAWREAQRIFYNFLNFFAIFLEISITSRVGIDRMEICKGVFKFLEFFLQFLWNFLLRVGYELIGAINFFIAWTEATMVFFNFLNFFWYFFRILYSESSRNWSERLFLFSHFLGLSRPVLAWREELRVFHNFLIFFSFFFSNSLVRDG